MQLADDGFAWADTRLSDMTVLTDSSDIHDAARQDSTQPADSSPPEPSDAQVVDALLNDGAFNDADRQDAETEDAERPNAMMDMGPEYTQAELDYFLEVVMNIEFGDTGMQRIHKWTGDLDIEVHGEPNPTDLAELDLIVAELNELQSAVTLSVVPENGNVQLYFSGAEAFRAVEPNYRNGNSGFFWTYWRAGAIVRANVFVLKTQADVYRRHLLREELTQSMGLMNDSNVYEDSIFHARWTDTTAFSAIDRTIIGMLYREDIEVNMGAEEVLDVLNP